MTLSHLAPCLSWAARMIRSSAVSGACENDDSYLFVSALSRQLVGPVAVVVERYCVLCMMLVGVECPVQTYTGLFEGLLGAMEELARFDQVIAVDE